MTPEEFCSFVMKNSQLFFPFTEIFVEKNKQKVIVKTPFVKKWSRFCKDNGKLIFIVGKNFRIQAEEVIGFITDDEKKIPNGYLSFTLQEKKILALKRKGFHKNDFLSLLARFKDDFMIKSISEDDKGLNLFCDKSNTLKLISLVMTLLSKLPIYYFGRLNVQGI
jgi:hypothetical protein